MRLKLLLALCCLPLSFITHVAQASPRTVESVLLAYGPDARSRLAPYFADLPYAFMPQAAKLIAIKQTKMLEIWLQDQDQTWHYLRQYPIERASGSLRPKMRQGDLQVPEGVYRLDAANPNSRFHLSLRINYPNALDRKYGALEQRDNLGGNIFIHGSNVSTGCLALGDSAIEELFVLAHDIGLENIEVVISPSDPRILPLKRPRDLPDWVELKYAKIENSMAELKQGNTAMRY